MQQRELAVGVGHRHGGFAIGWQSIIGDYLLAFTVLGLAGLVSLLYGVLGGSEVAVKILVDVFLFFISFLIQREIVYR